MNKALKDEQNSVPLLRYGRIISSLSNSYGSSLKETRLTAILGYLISLAPSKFLNLFKINSTLLEVNIEYKEANGRSDILLITDFGKIIIEAKVDFVDPLVQAKKYEAQRFVLLTNYHPLIKKTQKKIIYINWQKIFSICEELKNARNYQIKFLSTDIIKYLQEHRMVKRKDIVEIYAREINEERTLAFFLHGRLYGCDFEQGSRIEEAGYFAPHFGQSIANKHPGISVGIGYIAKIDNIDFAVSANDVKKIIIKHRGKNWLKKNKNIVDPILKGWPWDGRRRIFLFLSEPRLAFNPPVKKELLQKGKGWLSKRYLTFDELFKAWSGKSIY